MTPALGTVATGLKQELSRVELDRERERKREREREREREVYECEKEGNRIG